MSVVNICNNMHHNNTQNMIQNKLCVLLSTRGNSGTKLKYVYYVRQKVFRSKIKIFYTFYLNSVLYQTAMMGVNDENRQPLNNLC